MLRLEDILGREKLILVDTSMISIDEVDFAREIYDAKHFDQLDTRLIKRKILQYGCFAEILTHSNCYTIKEVTEEIRKFEEIVNAKIQFASSIPLAGRSRIRQIESAKERPERLMHQLQQAVYEARIASCRREMHRHTDFKEIEGASYGLLLDIVKSISRGIHIKRDTAHILGQRDKDMSEESDTDERLVAALYWLSLSGRRAGLISQDTDFLNLFGDVTKTIGADSFLPYNEDFRKGILENPFMVYIRDVKTQECGLSIGSAEVKYQQRFWIRDMEVEKIDELKHQIYQMWQRFASIQ